MSHDLSNDGNMSLSDNEVQPSNANEGAEDNQNEENDDNNDPDGKRVDPKTSRKRIVRNPIPKLNAARLKGPKGVHTIEKYFEGFKFHGKGHEKGDLDRVMKRLEHWAHRLFPKYQLDDFLEKVEALGSKKELQTFVTKYRRDMLMDEAIVQDNEDNDVHEKEQSPPPVDEFDLLIAEQIEKTKQVTVSQSNQSNVNVFNSNVETNNQQDPSNERNSATDNVPEFSEEIKERIERNRQLAIRRKLANMKRNEEMKKRKIQESSATETSRGLSVIASTNSESLSTNDNTSATHKATSSPDKRESSAEVGATSLHVTEIDLIPKDTTIENIETTVTLDDQPLDDNIQRQDQRETIEHASVHPLEMNKTSKPLLTDEELNREIDEAVNQFMNKKRQTT